MEASVQSTTGSQGVRISINNGSNAGYTMFQDGEKNTGYPLHTPVSPFTSPLVYHCVPSHFNWTLLQWEREREGRERDHHDFMTYCEMLGRMRIFTSVFSQTDILQFKHFSIPFICVQSTYQYNWINMTRIITKKNCMSNLIITVYF